MERSKESGENMDRYKRSTNGRMDLNGGGFIMMTQPGGNINALWWRGRDDRRLSLHYYAHSRYWGVVMMDQECKSVGGM